MTAAHDLAISRGFLRPEDVDLIESAVARLVAAGRSSLLAVNLGAGSGTTALAVLCYSPIHAFVDCFDVSLDNLRWCELALQNVGKAGSHRSHRIDSVEAARSYADGGVDLLMIDTSHEYEHTVAEIIAWQSKVALDGFVWLHDYVGDYPGVTQAVDEAVAAGVLEAIEVRGLGWLGRYRS